MLKRFLLPLLLLTLAPPGGALADTPQAPATASTAAKAQAPLPKVVLHTSEGDITIELFPNKSPKSVANFMQYVKSGFYDGTVFHRVIEGYLIQGGIYNRQLVQKRTRDPVPAESDNGLSNLRGTVAVARGADPDSGTSQFFINLVDNRRLDYINDKSGQTWGYTVFGKVIKGMDVVDKIGSLPTHAQGPFAGDVPEPLVVIKNAAVVGANKPAVASSAPASASSAPAPKSSKKSDASKSKAP
ncbi:MAG TPA: peptidylprolyl isomerase [Oleiagrimonas sp.]|nr:peptidylprolyl isomerase [Oleiagrimonas sp.]